MSEHTAEKDAHASARCPGSLRTPEGTTTLPYGGGKVGGCRSCGRIHLLRQDGTVRAHQTRVIPPGGGRIPTE